MLIANIPQRYIIFMYAPKEKEKNCPIHPICQDLGGNIKDKRHSDSSEMVFISGLIVA